MAGPLDDDLDQEQAEDGAADRADATRETTPADDRRGDRVKLVGDAEPRIGLAAPAGEEHAPERREHARKAVGDRLEPPRRQAAEPRRHLVAAECEEVAAQHGRPHHHARRRGHDREDGQRPPGIAAEDPVPLERDVDRLVPAQDRRQAPQARHRGQRGDERREPELVDHQGVQQADGQAQKQGQARSPARSAESTAGWPPTSLRGARRSAAWR